jgi:hypothetical protein
MIEQAMLGFRSRNIEPRLWALRLEDGEIERLEDDGCSHDEPVGLLSDKASMSSGQNSTSSVAASTGQATDIRRRNVGFFAPLGSFLWLSSGHEIWAFRTERDFLPLAMVMRDQNQKYFF